MAEEERISEAQDASGAGGEAFSSDLRIRELRFDEFRSYERFELGDVGDLTVFVGPNASGKTNAVEGIQLLTAFGSFRGAKSKELIRWGADQAVLRARILSDTRDLDVRHVLQPGHRSCLLNGKRKTVQDMQGVLPSVAFSPDDLVLVKGAQTHRRAALDLLGCQLSRSHRILKRDYERIVRHKNALLRDGADPLLLMSVDDMMAVPAVQLYLYRSALFRNLSARIARAYASITRGEERVEMGYVPSWEDESVKQAASWAPMRFEYDKAQALEAFAQALEARRAEEAARKRACVGPHADRIEFFIDGRNAAIYASQGQQRSLVLAWKIAEVGLVREMAGVSPVLLLDDVMSELDASRRHALVSLLRQDIQTFITTTETAFFEDDIMERANVVRLG